MAAASVRATGTTSRAIATATSNVTPKIATTVTPLATMKATTTSIMQHQ